MAVASTEARLGGKAAIVTGGAGGIGAAVAQLFRAHGAKVLIVDREANDGLVGNVTDPKVAKAAVDLALEKFGALHVLVNNAAYRNTDTLAEASEDEWRTVFETNVLGALNFCKAALPALRAARGSSIVNVSSAYALHGRKGFAAYDASKAALLAMTRSAALEEAAHGVRVNAVCPGGTLTPFTIGRGKTRGKSEADLRAEKKGDSLLGRWAEPLEVAWPILWLASDEASYITGAVIPVDGGLSAM